MKLLFYKYQGTGNDFIIIDNRKENFPKNDIQFISKLCDRKFGVGSDGLLLLENNDEFDFTMIYYNADGKLGSMCGNGGRCIVHFANYLGIIKNETEFEAVDGPHKASIKNGIVSLKMNDVKGVDVFDTHVFLDTGSPHHVQMVTNLEDYDVDTKGAHIRNTRYGEEGSNINFVEAIDDQLFAVRTYERGVEGETLSCGTGVTAVAISLFETHKTTTNSVRLATKGGILKVAFNKTKMGYSEVFLEGPAEMMFKGTWI